jgi:hypothetical protein
MTEPQITCITCEEQGTCEHSLVPVVPYNCVFHAFKECEPECSKTGIVQAHRWVCDHCGLLMTVLEQPRFLRGCVYFGGVR